MDRLFVWNDQYLSRLNDLKETVKVDILPILPSALLIPTEVCEVAVILLVNSAVYRTGPKI
jgi:hypothetical protein